MSNPIEAVERLTDEPENDLVTRLTGRAAFLRDRGETKTPSLLEEAAQALSMARQSQGGGEAVAWLGPNRQLVFATPEVAPSLKRNGYQPLFLSAPPPAEIGATVGHLAASYELTKQIGRMTHSGDEDWLDDADDNRATIDGLIAKARDIMAMPSTAQGGGGTVEEIARVEQHIGWLNTRAELLGLMDEPGDKENATYFRQIAKDLSRLSTRGAGREVVEVAKADSRYPAVFYSRNDPPRLGVARYNTTPDYITIDMSLENKPGARWLQGEFNLDEAEQIALHILKKVGEARAAAGGA